MTHEQPAPLALKDCWDEFEKLLRTIETLFGDLFDAPEFILRTAARRVEMWLRDGEAVARALLLAMAATMVVVLKPTCAKTSRQTQRAKPQWRFGFVAQLARTGKPNVRYALSPEQKKRLEEARHEERYQRRMFGFDSAPPRACAQSNSRGAPFTLLAPRAPASPLVDRAGIVRRYNGLIHVLQDRKQFAARLARRLARQRERTIARALARRVHKPGERPSPYEWLVAASQAHAPECKLDSS
ncbi:MAG: hypothetical protein FD124_2570 [Alphaproteobacteria bacterium]|nr:MAG: hypothetical protein FD124_2570 [Alphaproteobacteria bacterium]